MLTWTGTGMRLSTCGIGRDMGPRGTGGGEEEAVTKKGIGTGTGIETGKGKGQQVRKSRASVAAGTLQSRPGPRMNKLDVWEDLEKSDLGIKTDMINSSTETKWMASHYHYDRRRQRRP